MIAQTTVRRSQSRRHGPLMAHRRRPAVRPAPRVPVLVGAPLPRVPEPVQPSIQDLIQDWVDRNPPQLYRGGA